MNTKQAGARESSGKRSNARRRSDWTWADEVQGQNPAWFLEDIDAPEAWTLASFDDVVPREIA